MVPTGPSGSAVVLEEFGTVLEADIESVGCAWILCWYACEYLTDAVTRQEIFSNTNLRVRSRAAITDCWTMPDPDSDYYRQVNPFIKAACEAIECLREIKGTDAEPGWWVKYNRCIRRIGIACSVWSQLADGEVVRDDAIRNFWSFGPGG